MMSAAGAGGSGGRLNKTSLEELIKTKIAVSDDFHCN